MLLTELVKVFAEHFNISTDDINVLLKNNNIRIIQRLLLENKEPIVTNQEPISNILINKPKPSKCVKAEDKCITNIKAKVQANADNLTIELPINNPNSEIKPTRGRGRPRKNTIMKEEEEDVCVEVEELELEGVHYYKTNENVILSKSLEVVGILRDGVLRRTK